MVSLLLLDLSKDTHAESIVPETEDEGQHSPYADIVMFADDV